jgi:hypothetical protein
LSSGCAKLANRPRQHRTFAATIQHSDQLRGPDQPHYSGIRNAVADVRVASSLPAATAVITLDGGPKKPKRQNGVKYRGTRRAACHCADTGDVRN